MTVENKEIDKSLLPENEIPENTTEYVEKLLIENIRNIKFSEKENIPADVKFARSQYLEKQQQILLDRLDELKDRDDSTAKSSTSTNKGS